MLTLVSIISAMLFAGVADNKAPWEEIKNDDGIRVWVREVAGSSIREVKAETQVYAAADKVWAVVRDVPHYAEFMPYVLQAKVVGDAGANARYEYQLIDPPLVDRRDYTLKATDQEDPATGVYRREWVPANDKGPPLVDGVVRVQICDGYWLIERQGDKQTKVTYWLYTDPGGKIPAWIANKANTTSVPDLIRAVRNRSQNPAWRRD
ncbi:MAG: cyclase [Deltaproteobacteria bacterium]|nr:cyclase [Deltaproteobacteria bacterium]